MNTKTRDALTVLREVDSALLSRRLTPFECGELHEAIAQVESLVKSAQLGADALERVASLVPPELAMLISDRAMFLRDDLEPFTTGQSETRSSYEYQDT